MKMLKLYRAMTNAMNLYVIEDTKTGLYIVADWDLSDDEENNLIEEFKAGNITGEEMDGVWSDEETAFQDTFDRVYLENYTCTKIKLTDDAQICGYDGAEHRLHTPKGKASAWVLRDTWYQATAQDADGTLYEIVWAICEGWNPNEDTDQENACDWEHPAEVLNLNTGKPVAAEIEF